MTTLHNSGKAATSDTQELLPSPFCSAHGSLETYTSNKDSCRRRFVQMTVGVTLAGLVAAAVMEFATPRPVLAQSKVSPDAALQALMDGNRRLNSGRLTAHEQGLAILKHN